MLAPIRSGAGLRFTRGFVRAAPLSPIAQLPKLTSTFQRLSVGAPPAALATEPESAELETMHKLKPADPAATLAAFRKIMKENGVEAYIVPSEDPHMSEYPPDCCARRVYISNFTGSAGTAVITADKALLWTDGRYFLQAEQELPTGWELMRSNTGGTPDIADWLATNVPAEGSVGIDAQVHTVGSARDLERKLTPKGVHLKCIEGNLVDSVWTDRPGWPCKPVRVHKLEHAGVSVVEKLAALARELAAAGADALLVNDLAETAWLTNLRGADVNCNPVFVSYAIVTADGATLFVHAGAVDAEVEGYLKANGVTVAAYDKFEEEVYNLAKGGKKLWVSPAGISYGTYQNALAGAEAAADGSDGKRRRTEHGYSAGQTNIHEAQSPIQVAKAVKNEKEVAGMVEAHMRDAVALCDHFSWFEEQMEAGKEVTEVELDEHLTAARARQPGYIGPSFPTIAGCNGNGAIIHYRAQEDTCKTIDKTCMLLVDSGGQYDCGTTDITRTFHFGEPTQHQKDCYTRVLQGHIALDSAVFPEGTPGFVLDAFARAPLWAHGLNYMHGTGHGVGAALNVHEGPQGISFRYGNPQPLMVNMIVSNEPGYYEDNKFGIRIENLAVIEEAKTEYNFAGKTYMCMKPVTVVPIETKLMDKSIMTEAEVAWVNKYHAVVKEKVTPLLEGNERALAWLNKKTEAF